MGYAHLHCDANWSSRRGSLISTIKTAHCRTVSNFTLNIKFVGKKARLQMAPFLGIFRKNKGTSSGEITSLTIVVLCQQRSCPPEGFFSKDLVVSMFAGIHEKTELYHVEGPAGYQNMSYFITSSKTGRWRGDDLERLLQVI